MKKQTLIMMASTKQEAKVIADKQYGNKATYVKPYRYVSKGNNFYEFDLVVSK